MGRILRTDICFCDMCGKRTNKSYGRLALFKKNPKAYSSQITVKSWGLCQKCMGKMSAMETVGDKIKDEIETKLAKIQIENTPLELLK